MTEPPYASVEVLLPDRSSFRQWYLDVETAKSFADGFAKQYPDATITLREYPREECIS